MDGTQNYRRAKRAVEAIKGFYIHFFVFCVVMTGLLVLNSMISGIWWVQWPLLGWGLGVAAHAAAVYGLVVNRFGANWEEKKIRSLMAKQAGR